MSDSFYTSQDFQSDYTDGYPTVLCWNQSREQAWIEPAPAFDDGSPDAVECQQSCDSWGKHPCSDWSDFNELLERLGEDAVRNAYVEEESDEFGGMSLS